MTTFQVFLTGQKESVIVKAEKCTEKDDWLQFFVGEDIVGKFKVSEIQGWKELKQSR